MTSGSRPRRPSGMPRTLRSSRLRRFEYWPSIALSNSGDGRHWIAPNSPSRISDVFWVRELRDEVAKYWSPMVSQNLTPLGVRGPSSKGQVDLDAPSDCGPGLAGCFPGLFARRL